MPELSFLGCNFVASSASSEGQETISLHSRLDGTPLDGAFRVATPAEVARAAASSEAAFWSYSATADTIRADFLEAIAAEIEKLGDSLLERAHQETALPLARLTGERARTCGQLRQFANLLREGKWRDVRIDPADPDRAAGPKPDLRRTLVALGPVAVFGASNFPLAFSVAGGDTASALAAGCPLVVKAHPAHPGTSELVARAIIKAVDRCGIDPGVFNMLHGGAEVGKMLVLRPEISAVGFTGSKAAGRALFDLAAGREHPIPVFAEMGSVNPVFLLPHALAERGGAIAEGYAASLTMGVGQFCTNPGVVVAIAGQALDAWTVTVAEKLRESAAGTMLTSAICESYCSRVEQLAGHGLQLVAQAEKQDGKASAALFTVDADRFVRERGLQEEVFGPAALVVSCKDREEMLEVARALEGQLTATIHFQPDEESELRELLPLLMRRAGRILANGFPTGVEVSPAMQHGGPYPASTDPRFTSVGTAAIERFLRPVAFQNMPESLLPPELRA